MKLFLNKLLILLVWCQYSLAQEAESYVPNELYFQTYTTKDGLPSQVTHNAFQDRQGFLWISTDEGLTRYDGYDFKPYFDDVKSGIRLKGVCGFYEDKSGIMWVISGSGYLHQYDRIRDVFLPIPIPAQDGWNFGEAHSIIADQDDNLWISGHGGIQHYHIDQDSIRFIPAEAIRRPDTWPHPEKVRIGQMYLQEDKALWMGTTKFGFVKYDLQLDTFTYYRFDQRYEMNILSDWITDIIPIDDHTLLIGDQDNGMVFWDIEKEEISRVIYLSDLLGHDKPIMLNDIEPVTEQLYWLATREAGMMLVDIQQETIIQHYQPVGQTEMVIDGPHVSHVSRDRNGSYWIGSNSLQLCSPRLRAFKTYLAESNQPDPLPHNDIYALTPSHDGQLWLSTSVGVAALDPEEQKFNYPILGLTAGDASWGILSLSPDSAWVASDQVLSLINPQNNDVLRKYQNNLIIDEQNNWLRQIRKIMPDKHGNVWMIDHWGRLKYIDAKKGIVTNVFELAQDSASGKFVNVLDIIDDPEHDRIIVGMDMGLALVSYDRKVSRISLSHLDEDLSKAVYSYFYRDDGGDIWGIINGKVYQYHPDKNNIEFLDLNERYQVSAFRWIIEEPSGIFWMASHRGIVKYNQETHESSLHYTENVGGGTLDKPSPVAELDGKIYFSGYKGLSVIDPEKVSAAQSANQVVISDLLVNGKKRLQNVAPSDTKELDLPHTENDLDITLTNFTFVSQQNCKYRYRLLPQDEAWIDIRTEHTLALYNLPPDDYTLEVLSSNSDGQWSDQVLQMGININPAWWDTVLARGLFFLLIIGSIYYYQRLKYLARLKKQQEMEVLRNKISKDLHDDVGTVLTGIAMQSELMESFADEASKPMAEQIAFKSRQAMERMRDAVWAIDSRRDSVLDLKDRMLDFIDENLPNKEITYDMKLDIFSQIQKIAPNARQAAYLIFKESIVNIMKHSDTAAVTISLATSKESITISIQDQGTEKDKIKNSGQGLGNMKSRAVALGGRYSFNYAHGYKTTLELPLL